VSDKPIRLRFAPSPTGSLHIGGVRLALFNWLFTRKYGGKHILRIEDTDQKRYIEDSVKGILEAFEWLGFEFDEGPHIGGDYGPYVQSERLDLYQKWAHWLVENGHAYKAFETEDELSAISEERKKHGLSSGYDGRGRDLSKDAIAKYESEGRPYVIRIKMPREGKTVAEDAIRGAIEFENEHLIDTVLLKSDGFATYHLAHVIDDHFMEISHITRGVEWLPSLPIHWNLFEAFGWDKPVFAHMPLILKPDGKGKLSKREPVMQDGTRIPSLAHDFIEDGYLPEATINFLINIGWNFGDNQEIFTFDEAAERFELADVNKANGAYPIKKLDAINGEYIRKLGLEDLSRRLRPFLEKAGYEVNEDLLDQIVPIIQVRMKTLAEAVEVAGFLFSDWGKFEVPPIEWLIHKKSSTEQAITILSKSIEILDSLANMSPEVLYEEFKTLATEMEISNSVLFTPLRIAVTGQQVHPPIFETIEILGKDESIRRINLVIEQLKQTRK
jgi:glutamyl-tRNA synthetase